MKTTSSEDYWNRESSDFSKIYSHEKSWIGNTIDRIFRQDMYQRYVMTLKSCEPVKDRAFLDIGCGNGLYSIELAQRGAGKVIGLDISENMLTLAKENSKNAGTSSIITFKKGDVLKMEIQDIFDISFAVGFFDYVKDPLPLLNKMKSISRDKVIATFPRKWSTRPLHRKPRLCLKGCPVYFFSKKKIEEMSASAGFSSCNIQKVGKLYFAVFHAK